MWTQRDQLQAYQFLRRRAVSALQFGDGNSPTPPSRRTMAGAGAGVAAALLVGAAVGVYGLLRPGGGDWRAGRQIVIEQESGASFVLGSDRLLHPMLNYASARLLVGGTASVRLPASSLADAPRGATLGIAGAPASLPGPGSLVGGAWSVCTRPQAAAGTGGDRGAGGASGTGGTARPGTTVMLGAGAAGVRPAPEQAVVVDDGGGRSVLVAGARLRLRDQAAAVALGLDATPPTPVPQAWLALVPPGPDLAAIPVSGAGARGPRVGQLATRVGQVLVTGTVGAGDRFYLVLATGVAPVGQTQAALVLAAPASRAAYPTGSPQALRVSAADIAGAPQSDKPAPGGDLPDRAPVPLDPRTAALCAAATADGPVEVLVSVDPLPPGARPVPLAAAPGGSAGAGAPPAPTGQVYLPPGHGMLLRDQHGARWLVSDQGTAFPVAGDPEIDALGYRGSDPVPIGAALLALLPTGPTLDRTAAGRPAPR